VADITVSALRAVTPTTTASGAPSKAKYTLDAAMAERCRARCAELLHGHPLYPEVDLAVG
jgi:glycine hydroxymethyltransferase